MSESSAGNSSSPGDATKAKSTEKLKCLCIGLSPATVPLLGSKQALLEFENVPMDISILMDIADESAQLVLCGPPGADVQPVELAQLLRMKFQRTPIFLVVDASGRIDRKLYVKNGFTDVFFLPMDKDVFLSSTSSAIEQQLQTGATYRAVKIGDMDANAALSFDTYLFLPSSNKHVRMTRSGEGMSQNKIDKFKQKGMSSIQVSERDLPKFYSYTADRLKKLGQDETMSETQRSEKLKGAVRDVLTGMFSDQTIGTDGGKRIVEDCQNIVKTYVTGKKPGTLYDKISQLAGDGSDSYSHVSNVSTYASMIAIGLGLKTVEEVALAGLLHDIGLSKIPNEIQSKPESERTLEERTIFQSHVDQSIAIIQDRKLVVSERIHKIILQHHERFDGKGYPKGITGTRFTQESQILAFADQMDEYTALVPGQPRKTIADALKMFREMLISQDAKYDPELLKKILVLFGTVEEAAAS